MLPWEHVAASYLAYSLFSRVVYRRPPRGDAVVVVLVAAGLPDLIDKPLAWGFNVIPSGQSLAHSLLFAGPAILLARLATGRRLAIAFGLSYLVHVGGDVVFPVALGQSPRFRFLLWPLIDMPSTTDPGFFVRLREVLGVFFEFLATTRGQVYLLFEGVLLGSAFVLWLLDGHPGPSTVLDWFRPEREGPHGS